MRHLKRFLSGSMLAALVVFGVAGVVDAKPPTSEVTVTTHNQGGLDELRGERYPLVAATTLKFDVWFKDVRVSSTGSTTERGDYGWRWYEFRHCDPTMTTTPICIGAGITAPGDIDECGSVDSETMSPMYYGEGVRILVNSQSGQDEWGNQATGIMLASPGAVDLCMTWGR